MHKPIVVSLAAFGMAALLLAGCSNSSNAPANEAAASAVSATHSHEEWWCSEHGVPEEVCAQCHPKIAAEFKAKGDWCQEHDRPDSQCFICHPEYQAKFAALYEAKYGKQPPKPE
jgi:hypothetical protein